MSYNNFELVLLDGSQIYNIRDLALLWGYSDIAKVQNLVRYYINKSKLFRLKNGLYSTVPNPDSFLIAQKAFNPSYISFYTALKYHGINFQWYDSVSSASLRKYRLNIKDQIFEYKQLKKEIFFNQEGIISENGYNIAGPERAFCDTLYLDKNAYFDNLDKINTEKLKKIATIYNQKTLNKSINQWFDGLIEIK